VMFEMLPVNLAGVLMLLGGVAFLVVELHVPGFGLPGIAGTASLVLGGLLLFDAGTLVRVSRPLLVGTVIGMALFVLAVLGRVARARRLPPHIPPTLVGAEGVATTALDPVGTVRVRSEDWTAESTVGPIPAGARVLVIDEKGLTLRVDPLDAAGGFTGPSAERRL
jgi:membrane-bound serine protease (ClpP class)